MSWSDRIFGVAGAASLDDGAGLTAYRGPEGAVALIPLAMRGRGRGRVFAERIDALLSALPVTRLSRLDRAVRHRAHWNLDWFGEWRLGRVLPEHLPEHRDLFLCLALCHPSGYVRQAAIRRVWKQLRRGALSRHGGLALQLLVLRRNDWVEPVASKAAAALDQRLVDADATTWVQALPVVERLADFKRREHAEFVEAVRTQAASAAWGRPLLEAIGSTDPQISRTATRYALKSPALDAGTVVRAALDASAPLTRLLAARAAQQTDDAGERQALLDRLDVDAFMPVRREALRLRTAWFPDSVSSAHERLLFDPSRALRAEAQAAIAKAGGDAAGAYRRHLQDTEAAHATTALLGLGEVGLEADAHLAERHLGAPRARRRAAAIRCLARLAGDRHIETFLAALVDAAPRVSRAAARALDGRVHRAGIERVLAVLDDPPYAHVRRVVLGLLYENDQWASLGPLVRCAAEGDPKDADWADVRLGRWFTRHPGWTRKPPAAYVDALREALTQSGSRLNASLRRELEFLLGSLSKA